MSSMLIPVLFILNLKPLFAFTFVTLKVNNSIIILFRFSLISVSVVTWQELICKTMFHVCKIFVDDGTLMAVTASPLVLIHAM